jgi:pimeloyl-ACP methyl ester carboxylesterase
VALVNPVYNRNNRDILYVSITIISAVFLFGMSFSILYESTLDDRTADANDVYAQPYVETVKHRDLTLDLGNGTKTNAQLTIPAVGEGPFPGVLLLPGSGAVDMNETAGHIRIDNQTGSKIYPAAQPLFQIANYLSERGFVTLRYDKRGIGPNYTITDSNAWGNLTFDNLKQDAEKALSVLLQQPEVNATEKATVFGHSEGTTVAPRVAVDNQDKVKNVVLMGAIAQNALKDVQYYQEVAAPLLYAERVLDRDHKGLFSVAQASEDPIFNRLINQASGSDLAHVLSFIKSNVTETQNRTAEPQPIASEANASNISIENELKPALIASYENHTSFVPSMFSVKCLNLIGCPAWVRSHIALDDTLSMIGNVSSSILVLQGENDSQVPLEQGLLLQQRLTEINHPDHLLIAYPNLGHAFSPSNEWISSFGPIEQYVLQDMYEWLVSPAREVNEQAR